MADLPSGTRYHIPFRPSLKGGKRGGKRTSARIQSNTLRVYWGEKKKKKEREKKKGEEKREMDIVCIFKILRIVYQRGEGGEEEGEKSRSIIE